MKEAFNMLGLDKRAVIVAILRGADLAALAEVIGCKTDTFQNFFESPMIREECYNGW